MKVNEVYMKVNEAYMKVNETYMKVNEVYMRSQGRQVDLDLDFCIAL